MKPGERFGRLRAIKFVRWHLFPYGKRQPIWEFLCDCGNRTEAFLSNVKSLHTNSCGCLYKETRGLAQLKHGDAPKGKPSHLYTVWCGIKQRCEDTNCRLYPRWGGRGIKVLSSCYEGFKRDMQPTYQAGLQIERIDNDGHYCKENCRWATAKEQALNRRSNVLLEFKGQRKPMKVWADEFGLRYSMLQSRIRKGWSAERALGTPKTGPMFLTFRRERLPLRTWAKRVGMDYRRIWSRIKSGWSVQRALTTDRYGRKAESYE